MTQPTLSLKQFVVWVTDLTDKYRFDANVRTTLQIILLQIGLTLVSVMVFGWAISYAQHDTVAAISRYAHDVLRGTSSSTELLPQSVIEVRNRIYLYVFTGMVLLNTLFGYLIARFALRPGRETLRFQKRFISNVAHEIRTPLAIVKTSTEVTLLDPTLSQDVRETLNDTVIELDRISETINNLLSFDTLTRPKTMQFESVDVGEIAETVITRHQDLAHSRNVLLIGHTRPGLTINGNATALDQVITNLVKNAINYTPEGRGGQVAVDCKRDQNGDVVVSVADTGIGIAQKDLYHIFEPFYRADTSRARGIGTGSSGLGLAIVNEIVRLHHGKITLRSAVGHGTTIKIVFPKAIERSGSGVGETTTENIPHETSIDFS